MGRLSTAEKLRIANPVVNTVEIVEIVNGARPVPFAKYPDANHANTVLDRMVASGQGLRIGKNSIKKPSGWGPRVLEIREL